MDQCILFILVLTHAVYTANALTSYTEAYCWRDYKGIIPSDAVSAGNQQGKPVYIGQVLVDDKVIPGEIFPGDKKIYYELGEQAWHTEQNIKILCSDHPEIFKWIPTKKNNYHELKDEILIRGGHEPGFKTFIGRAHEDGDTSAGKIVCWDHKCLALYTTRDDRYIEYDTYEALAYDVTKLNSI